MWKPKNLAIVFAFSVAPVAAFGQPSPPLFVPLTPLPGHTITEPWGISADGLTVVGYSRGGSSILACRWTLDGIPESLGLLPGATFSIAEDVSADGSCIVGGSGMNLTERAFRWTKVGGMVDLGLPSGAVSSHAFSVSSDGSVVVGDGFLPSEDPVAFRWTAQTGFVSLGSLNPNPPTTSSAREVSANGLIVVGRSDPNSDWQVPFRWSASTGMTAVQNNCFPMVGATAVSATGATIVGGNGSCTFRSVSGNCCQIIPNMGQPFGISGDGLAVVGYHLGGGTTARIWTATCGTRTLKDLVLAAGQTQASNWAFQIGRDVADDKRSIIGMGRDPNGAERGFLVRLPKIGDADFNGVVDIDDLLLLLARWGPCNPAPCPLSDFNCDGTHNVDDLLAVINNWG